MQTVGVSQRQACSLVGIWRGTCRYQTRGNWDEGLIRQRLRDLAAARPRFGSPRLGVLLRQELGIINHKRVERLYAEEGLQLPKRRKKLRRSFSRVMLVESPTGPLQRWSLDFIHDSLRDGRRFRTAHWVGLHGRLSQEEAAAQVLYHLLRFWRWGKGLQDIVLSIEHVPNASKTLLHHDGCGDSISRNHAPNVDGFFDMLRIPPTTPNTGDLLSGVGKDATHACLV